MANRWTTCGSRSVIASARPGLYARPAMPWWSAGGLGALPKSDQASSFARPLLWSGPAQARLNAPGRAFATFRPKAPPFDASNAAAASIPQAAGPPRSDSLPSPPPSPTPPSPTLAWLEKVEGKLERGGQKAIEGAMERTQRALRGELASAVRSGNLAEAEHTWTELRARAGSRMDEASCHTLMNAYAQRGHLRRALSLYARMKEWRVRPSPHTFSILFNAYANLAQPSPAYLPKLKQLKDQEMPRYGVAPSVEIYNVLLKAYLALDPEKSNKELKNVIAEMRDNGLKPDAITYTLWMATAARGAADNPKATVDVAAAFEVWDEMKKNRVRPNLRGYNELLKICTEGSPEDRDIAFELYKEMLVEGITPDHHTFDILLMTCWKQRRFNLANDLFDKAVQLNADRGKLELDTHLCNSALRVCTRTEAKKGRKSGAEPDQNLLDTIAKITKVMFRKHLPYDEETYALLISAYTRAGAKDKAMNTFADMQTKGQVRISKKTIGALLVVCRESDDVEEVKKVLDIAKERQVKLSESMVAEIKDIFVKQKRYHEWTRVERELAEWLPAASKRQSAVGDDRFADEADKDDITRDVNQAAAINTALFKQRRSTTTATKRTTFDKAAPARQGRGGGRGRGGGDDDEEMSAERRGAQRPWRGDREEGEIDAREEGGGEGGRRERRRLWLEAARASGRMPGIEGDSAAASASAPATDAGEKPRPRWQRREDGEEQGGGGGRPRQEQRWKQQRKETTATPRATRFSSSSSFSSRGGARTRSGGGASKPGFANRRKAATN